MNRQYKKSRFNIQIDLCENQYLLYNSLSQGFSLLDQKEIDLLDKFEGTVNGNLSNEDYNSLDEFLINNFIIPDDVDETEKVKTFYFNERNKKDNMGITVLPTLDCNFCCKYCFEGGDKSNEFMHEKVKESIVNLIKKKKSEIKSLNITWFGGEPLMGMGIIKSLSNKIIPFCDMNELSYFATVITNGYLLSMKNVEELYIRKVRTIQVTLDGNKEEHDRSRFLKKDHRGTYDVILKNINAYLNDFPIKTIIRLNIDRQNIDSTFTLLDDLATRGLANNPNLSVYFAPIEASTNACANVSDHVVQMESFARFEFEAYKYAISKGLCQNSLPYRLVGLCTASRAHGLVILPNGDLHRCWETVSDPNKKIGLLNNGDDYSKNELEERWSGWNPFQHEECTSCPMLPNCAGYCAYRFLYKSEFHDKHKTPCPALKYNIKDKLIHFAASQDPEIAKQQLLELN